MIIILGLCRDDSLLIPSKPHLSALQEPGLLGETSLVGPWMQKCWRSCTSGRTLYPILVPRLQCYKQSVESIGPFGQFAAWVKDEL